MAKFTLEIECDNAAFQDDGADIPGMGALPEVGRILQRLSRELADGDTWGALLDGNGNRVGAWDYSE